MPCKSYEAGETVTRTKDGGFYHAKGISVSVVKLPELITIRFSGTSIDWVRFESQLTMCSLLY